MSGDFQEFGSSPDVRAQEYRKTNENVRQTLHGIQERGDRINRFTGADIIRAEKADIAFNLRFAEITENSEEAARLHARDEELTTVNKILATINADQSAELTDQQLEQVLVYFEEQRRMADPNPDTAETAENNKIYQAIIDDIYKQLEEDGRRQPERDVVLKTLTESKSSPQVRLGDGVRIVEAESNSLQAISAGLTESKQFDLQMLLQAFHETKEGLEKIMKIRGGEQVPFDYIDFINTIGYFRMKKETWDQKSADTDHSDDITSENGNIYAEVLRRIYEVMPYTPEARLLDLPRYLPVPVEKFLGILTESLKERGHLELSDTKPFYEALQTDVGQALARAETEIPQWQEQNGVMWEIDKEIKKLREQHDTGPLPYLRVTVRDGEQPEILPYNPGQSLMRDMQEEPGSRKFVFDPNSRDDMQYLSDSLRFNRYNAYAPLAIAGVEILTGERTEGADTVPVEEEAGDGKKKKKKKNKNEQPTITITDAQYDGMRFLFGLFYDEYREGRLDETYGGTIRELGRVIADIPSMANIVHVNPPDPLAKA